MENTESKTGEGSMPDVGPKPKAKVATERREPERRQPMSENERNMEITRLLQEQRAENPGGEFRRGMARMKRKMAYQASITQVRHGSETA